MVSAQGVSARGDGDVCIPASTETDTPPQRTELQIGVKTLPCRNFVADGKNVVTVVQALKQYVWVSLQNNILKGIHADN